MKPGPWKTIWVRMDWGEVRRFDVPRASQVEDLRAAVLRSANVRTSGRFFWLEFQGSRLDGEEPLDCPEGAVLELRSELLDDGGRRR